MTHPYKQLTDAADLLEKQAEALESTAKQLDKTKADVTKAKTAAAKALKQAKTAAAVKPAEVDKAKLAPLAKTAAANLRQAGLLSSQQNEDVFASEVLSHEKALAKIAQLAKFASTPRRAQVIEDDGAGAEPESADSVWEKTASAALTRLHLNNDG